MAEEIIKGDIHCFSDCGYNCKASVKAELEGIYRPMLEDVGKGWSIRSSHNAGWHCCLVHEATGFEVIYRAARGGINKVRWEKTSPEARFVCMNYSTDRTGQIVAYGETPYEAVKAAIMEMAERAQAYAKLAQDLQGWGK